MVSAGILLTGGSSRRLGTDKSELRLGGITDPLDIRGLDWREGETLAQRTARLLAGATDPAIEVGGAYTALIRVPDPEPGAGPLAAVAAGAAALSAAGWTGSVVVVAADLPFLTPDVLAWLADHPDSRSVVPRAGGQPQPLCARYRTEDLAIAQTLVASGRRAMKDLLARIDPLVADAPCGWAGELDPFADIDTPADLERARAQLG